MNKKDAEVFNFSVYNLPALNAIASSEDLDEYDKEKLFNQIINKYTSCIDTIPDACKFIRQLELYQIMYKQEEDRLYEKRKMSETLQNKIEVALIQLIEKSNVSSINSGLFDLGIKKTTSISDESNIEDVPNEYKYTKIETKLDKMKIKNDIKNGIDIKGVVLNTNKHLIIK